MLKMKSAALSIAVILALAACGGSSDAVDPTAAPGTPTSPGGDNTPPPADPGGNPTPPPEPPPPADAVINGDMVLGANQVLFNDADPATEDGILPIDYPTFSDTTRGAYGIAGGTNAPIQSFGLRVYPNANMYTGGAQSENIRIGIELVEVTGGQNRLIQMLIDKATFNISETGVLSVTVPADAQVHAVVRNAAGETATISAGGLAANTVRYVAIPDDPTSLGFTVNVDAAMSAAIAAATGADLTVLQSAKDVEGSFNMRMAISGIQLLSETATELTLAAPLTVGTQPTLAGGSDPAVRDGAGVAGVLHIGFVPAWAAE